MDYLTSVKKYNRYNTYTHINESKSLIINLTSPTGNKNKMLVVESKPPRDSYVLSYYSNPDNVYVLTNPEGDSYILRAKLYEKHRCAQCNGLGYTRAGDHINDAGILRWHMTNTECVVCAGVGYRVNFDDVVINTARVLSAVDFSRAVYEFDGSGWRKVWERLEPKRRGRKSIKSQMADDYRAISGPSADIVDGEIV